MCEWYDEIEDHLVNCIIPFWSGLRDDEYGGYYGYMDYETLTVDRKSVKGCIFHSRLLWFFSTAYTLLKDEKLLDEARHAYNFIKSYCLDKEYGGIFWTVTYDGKAEEDIKHTYNQAFGIYAMSAYYEASHDSEALKIAYDLFDLIENKCRDAQGYLEAFTREFVLMDNDKLSENGVMADRTMNTLLHVFECYCELYRVDSSEIVAQKIKKILDCFSRKIYNPLLRRLEVFFDKDFNSLIDLHSYGHDIETAWLIDRGLELLKDDDYSSMLAPITKALTQCVYETAFDGSALNNECERGVVNSLRVWWVQAEAVTGFLNGYEKDNSRRDYLDAARMEWQYIKEHIIDKRAGSEWLSEVDLGGCAITRKPIVEPWKAAYHNGRMCIEVIRRCQNMKQ